MDKLIRLPDAAKNHHIRELTVVHFNPFIFLFSNTFKENVPSLDSGANI